MKPLWILHRVLNFLSPIFIKDRKTKKSFVQFTHHHKDFRKGKIMDFRSLVHNSLRTPDQIAQEKALAEEQARLAQYLFYALLQER